MKRLFSVAVFVLGAVALTPAQGGNVLVIRGVTRIDGTGRGSVPNATVVIEGDTIKDVGAHAQAPAGARTIDGTGKFLMTPVAQDNRKRLNDAGRDIVAAGTDQSSGPALHRELELLVGGGISPADTIVIATRNAARALGKLDELGTIEGGKLADLVLLKADPTKDINNAKLVDLVIKNGQVIDRSRLDLPVNRRPTSQQ
jgi:imidazolonepropionase-like amidohydrolase